MAPQDPVASHDEVSDGSPAIHPRDPLPERADAVVVGAGIVGVCAARDLAARGFDVLLLDKGPVGREQSGRNWGWCRQFGRDRREAPLGRAAMAIWEEIQQQADVGFRRYGLLRVAADDRGLAHWQERVRRAGEVGLRAELLAPNAVRELAPDYEGPLAGAAWAPDDACAEPARAAPSIAGLARRAGASVRTGCAVHALRIARGRVQGVETEDGPVAAGRVLVAAGAWSAPLLRTAGVDLPQAYVLASVLRTTPADAIGRARMVSAPGTAIRQRADGGWSLGVAGRLGAMAGPATVRWLSTFWPMTRTLAPDIAHAGSLGTLMRGPMPPGFSAARYRRWRTLDPRPDARGLRRALAAARSQHGFLREAQVAERWAGVIDGTPDGLPVIDRDAGPDGLILATGFSGHGFGIGPGAGRLAADLVAGGDPLVDPRPFRLSRFTDGSQLTIEVTY
jgi:glycine/D-amino acid oxidase-like deaminating enzyme